MSQSTINCVIVGLLIPLWVLLRRNPIQGIAYAGFLCVSMPTALRIEIPGDLFQLPVSRLAVISLFVFWITKRELRSRFREVPLSGYLLAWVLSSLISLLVAKASFDYSLKRFLDYMIEAPVFYLVLVTTMRTKEDAFTILRGLGFGLTLVALLAVVEKKTGFNPVDAWIPGVQREANTGRDVLATYPHRILLGTAMAMGWPLVLALIVERKSRKSGQSIFLWGSIGMLLTGCYFAMSRGPWLGSMLAALVLGTLGSRWFRKKLPLLAGLGLLVIILRPGVLETIGFFAEQTADVTSFKGGTFLYRLELWKIAWAEISKSPVAILVGYGPGAGTQVDLDWDLSFAARTEKIWSWDNHFAYDLFQFGVVGLLVNLALCGAVIYRFVRLRRSTGPPGNDILVCLLASIVVLVYMKTNVLIFARQLDYLFWSQVAIGFVVARQYARAQPKIAVRAVKHEARRAQPVVARPSMARGAAHR